MNHYKPWPKEDYCDCDQRCKKCGKKKRPKRIQPIWIDNGPPPQPRYTCQCKI